jgi:hypothetical protein
VVGFGRWYGKVGHKGLFSKHYWCVWETVIDAFAASASINEERPHPMSDAAFLRIAKARSGLRANVARVARVQVGDNFVAKALDAATNGGHHNHAEANDGCGQNDPVNGYCAGFVVCKGFEDVQDRHGVTLSLGLLYITYLGGRVARSLFRPFSVSA